MNKMQLKKTKNPEIFLALKKICQFIIDELWTASVIGDIDFEYAIAKTKTYEQDVRKLANLDISLGWGDEKEKTGDRTWGIRHVGDFNPWYDDELTIEELLGSFEPIAEQTNAIFSKSMGESEFLHYFDFLANTIPKPSFLSPTIISVKELHPKIQEHCHVRFDDGHYSDAIFAAYKVVLNEIKDVTGIHNLDGKQLVERVFSLSNPIIKLNALSTQSDKDEQQGFMLLFSGAAIGIRNPRAHELVTYEDGQRALSYLVFASLLMQRLDERLEP